jgi:hypothetical protein
MNRGAPTFIRDRFRIVRFPDPYRICLLGKLAGRSGHGKGSWNKSGGIRFRTVLFVSGNIRVRKKSAFLLHPVLENHLSLKKHKFLTKKNLKML